MLQKLINNNTSKKSVIWWIGSYLLIIVLSIVINLYGYYSAIEVVSSERINALETAGENLKSLFDMYFYNMYVDVENIAMSDYVMMLDTDSALSLERRTECVNNISERLGDAVASSKFLSEGMMIFPEKNLCIDSDGMADLDSVYEYYYKDAYESREQWLNYLAGDGKYYSKIEKITGFGFCYICKFPFIASHSQNIVILKLDELQMRKTLKQTADNLEATIGIQSTIGRTLFSSGEFNLNPKTKELDNKGNITAQVNSRECMITYADSEHLDICYVLAVPVKVFENKITFVRTKFVLSYLLCTLICGIIAIIFAKINLQISERSRRKMKEQEMQISQELLSQILLKKLPENTTDIKNLIRTTFRIDSVYFAIAAISIRGNETDNNIFYHRIVEYMSQELGTECDLRFCVIDSSVVTLISYTDPMDYETKTAKAISKMNQMIPLNAEEKIICALSYLTDDASELADMYWQTADMLGILCTENKEFSVCVKSDNEGTREKYAFLPDMKNQLVGALCFGDVMQCKAVIDDIFEYNLKTLKINLTMFRSLTMAVGVAILEQTVGILESGEYRYVCNKLISAQNESGHERVRKYLYEMCSLICNARADKQSMKENENSGIDEIKGFIDSHYTDNMMCVGMIAVHFNLTPNYLSAKFKKVIGVGISEYVTQCRINKAKELFKDDKLTIDDISGIVGFSNSSVFSRAFKKLEGASPGQYRKILKINE